MNSFIIRQRVAMPTWIQSAASGCSSFFSVSYNHVLMGHTSKQDFAVHYQLR